MAKNASKHMTRMVELEEQQRRRRETRQGSKPQVTQGLTLLLYSQPLISRRIVVFALTLVAR